MYCLQWLLPVLLIPKPLNPALWFSHSMFMGFYLLSFLLERKPCTICALVFLAALFLICYSCWGNCFLYHCSGSQLPDSAHDPNIQSCLWVVSPPLPSLFEIGPSISDLVVKEPVANCLVLELHLSDPLHRSKCSPPSSFILPELASSYIAERLKSLSIFLNFITLNI
ncbi:Bladder cancer-associated protein [Varanus komodoensis]|nr:Bladder cancer-associated protein [Varanus komodoensis]